MSHIKDEVNTQVFKMFFKHSFFSFSCLLLELNIFFK